MWIIASIPFWILGTGCLVCALWGGFNCYRDDRTVDDFKTTSVGVIAFLVASGILFMIAAKVAS